MSKYFPESIEFVNQALMGRAAPGGGSWVQEFESQFAQKVGSKYAVSMNSGTSALHAGLASLGVGPGDEVISSAVTVIMNSFATLYLGATPVFADVNPNSWNLDPADVRKKITDRTKAIIVVGWFGLPVDMEPFLEIERETGIPILDDAAESLGSVDHNGNRSGSTATVGIFSFEEKKHMTTGGEGGMLVTNDATIAEKSRKFAGIGYRHLTAELGRTSLNAEIFQNPYYERFSEIGFNYRMTPIAAALGMGQLKNLDEIIQKRQFAAECILNAVKDCDWITPQVSPVGTINSYYTVGLRFDGEKKKGISWVSFYKRFRELGGDGFYGNCLNPFLEPVFSSDSSLIDIAGLARSACPIAVELQPHIMAFKTNYRDTKDAERQGHRLSQLIYEISQ